MKKSVSKDSYQEYCDYSISVDQDKILDLLSIFKIDSGAYVRVREYKDHFIANVNSGGYVLYFDSVSLVNKFFGHNTYYISFFKEDMFIGELHLGEKNLEDLISKYNIIQRDHKIKEILG